MAEAILHELQEQKESPVTGEDKAFCPMSTSLSLAFSPEIHAHAFTLTYTLTHIHSHTCCHHQGPVSEGADALSYWACTLPAPLLKDCELP